MPLSEAGKGHIEKTSSGRDLGAGSGAPSEAGTGHLTRTSSSRDIDGGRRDVPTETGSATGVKRAKGGSASVSRKADGVGGPLPTP